MKPILFFTLVLAAFVGDPARDTRLSNPAFSGLSPRLTTDEQHNPILSWVEQNDDKGAFCFARSTDDGQTFGSKVQIPAPANLSVHAEGMPKLAVKANGDMLALFEVPRPVPESRFAGDLLFVYSTDGGKTWSQPKPLHRNTAPGTSHSFSDLTRLPNGEIGIVWLDEKLPGQEGRPVKFAQTLPGGGFSEEVMVDDNACQCCRTNVFVDSKKQIHLSWRDMVPNPTPGQAAARDISHAVSADGGRTFSKPAVWLVDNWQVNACPHAGPSVAETTDGVFAAWFSGKEGNAGLRLARLEQAEPVATVPTNRAKHPQVTSQGNRLAWVWDETFVGATEGQSSGQKICLQTIDGLRAGAVQTLTATGIRGANPAVMAVPGGLVVAWEQRAGLTDNPVIVSRFLTSW